MSKGRLFLKHFSYNTLSTLLAMAIQIFVILVVAKLVGAKQFGYWQIYVFYVTYCGILHGGWCDGLYLILGGQSVEQLPWTWLKQDWRRYVLVEGLVAGLIGLWGWSSQSGDLLFVAVAIAVTVLLTNARTYLFSLMQASNQLLLFAQTNILDRLVYLGLMTLCLVLGGRDLPYLLGVDVVARVVSLAFAYGQFYRPAGQSSWSKEKTFDPRTNLSARSILKAGSALLLANLAGGLYIGIVRYFLQQQFSIESFGRLSLMISMANLVIFFVNGVSVIVFPFLKTLSPDQLAHNYRPIKRLFIGASSCLLVGYFPIRAFIDVWLPDYRQVMTLFAYVYPLFIFEGQLALLTNSYLKTYREERAMLRLNLGLLFFTLGLTYMSLILFQSLPLTFVSLLVIYMGRLWGSEWLLKRHLHQSFVGDNVWQLLALAFYLGLALTLPVAIGGGLYGLLLGVGVYHQRSQFVQALRQVAFEPQNQTERKA